MSDQAEERRKQQIRYSDEFRRAKRNTLFWAVVTLLLAVGAPAANSPGLELAGFKNMELSGPFLLGGSLVVLIFMVLGYVRAEADVITLNSDFALDHAFQNVVDTADDLIAHFRASIAHLSETRSQFNNLSRRFKEWLEPPAGAVTQFSFTPMDIDLMARKLAEAITAGQSSGEPLDVERMMPTLHNHLGVAGERLKEGTRDDLRKALLRERKKAARHLREPERRLLRKADELLTLSGSLQGLGEALDASEKRWFHYYDQLVVYGLSTLVATIAYARLLWMWAEFLQG